MSDPKSPGLKSAYELALERMERQGIERPDPEHLSPEMRSRMAEARSKTEAKLAELEILHRDRLRALPDPVARETAEEDYRRDRARLEEEGEREIRRLREESG